MKNRLLNKMYANLFGYFWLPCPICGKPFGGHEWKSGSDYSLDYPDGSGGVGICPDCGDKRKKERLQDRSKE